MQDKPPSSDAFQALIDKHAARMSEVRTAFERDGRAYAFSARNPSYSILLTKNPSSDAPFRVTSFDGRTPTGHREYDHLEGGGPVNSAFQEFANQDFRIVPLPRTRVAPIRGPGFG